MVRMREGAFSDALYELVAFAGVKDATLVEVGSYAGESADIFASMPQISRIFCIDPWKPGYDPSDIASSSDFSEVEKAFDRVVDKWDGKIVKFKGDFIGFSNAFKDEAPDIVYIDAKHDYESVLSDIQTARSMKAKIISGHDYNNNDWIGVVKAVNEMFGSPDRVFRDTSWIKIIK